MTGQQPYEAAERRDGSGLRRYPARLVARVGVAGSFDEVPNRAFGPLTGNINGASRARRRMVSALSVADLGELPHAERLPGAAGAAGCAAAPARDAAAGYAVTACLVSLLVTWMLRGLAASRTGMVRVSTPAA